MSLIPFYNYLPEELLAFPLRISDVLQNQNYSSDFGHQKTTVFKNENKFEVILDVHHFAPNELTVKTSDREIIIEGRHEEKRDEHGYIWRQFVRRYTLPDDHDPKDVESHLSVDGVLRIIAPKKAIPSAEGERVVQIKATGPVHKTIAKENQ